MGRGLHDHVVDAGDFVGFASLDGLDLLHRRMFQSLPEPVATLPTA